MTLKITPSRNPDRNNELFERLAPKGSEIRACLDEMRNMAEEMELENGDANKKFEDLKMCGVKIDYLYSSDEEVTSDNEETAGNDQTEDRNSVVENNNLQNGSGDEVDQGDNGYEGPDILV